MGCIETRQINPDLLHFINKDRIESNFVAIDCSIDSFDGKTLASEVFKYH